MSLPVHVPYDGSSKPFTIGLKPLDLATWIEVDHTFDEQLREKRRLFAEIPEKVLVAEPDTLDAQREILELVERQVFERFPERFRRENGGISIAGGPSLTAADMALPSPLHVASLLIQEDLILMRRGPDGWRLAAGSLCFPSSWLLGEKFGRPLQDIHQPVPGFGPGTRNAELINRMFDNLRVEQPVQRMNWSLQARHELYYPLSDIQRIARANNRPSKFPDLAAVARGFIRVERQTLRRLPVSGDLLFTIRIYLDPLSLFETHPDAPAVARAFIEQLESLDEAQLDYKGLTADRDRLVEWLRAATAAEV